MRLLLSLDLVSLFPLVLYGGVALELDRAANLRLVDSIAGRTYASGFAQ